METSLATLQKSRLERLKKQGDFYILPGIESWAAYSNKVGAGPSANPRKKLEKVIEQLNMTRPFVKGIQANFIFGLDVDAGDEPIELTREFARRAPFVMPNFNIPVPFGNTPLFDKYFSENRILTSMPFSFYYMPYLVFILKNYSAPDFYKKLMDITAYVSSPSMLLKRLKSAPSPIPTAYNTVKTLSNRRMIRNLHEILCLLETDTQFRDFHERQTDVLPEYYHRQYEYLLGPYASLMSREDRKPVLTGQKKKPGIVLNDDSEDNYLFSGV